MTVLVVIIIGIWPESSGAGIVSLYRRIVESRLTTSSM